MGCLQGVIYKKWEETHNEGSKRHRQLEKQTSGMVYGRTCTFLTVAFLTVVSLMAAFHL